MSHLYAVALGSNKRHGRHGSPERVLAAAVDAMRRQGIDVRRISSTRRTAALGPAGRSFANAAAIVAAQMDPPELLRLLKGIEVALGRRPGRRWGPRVLDLDILLWSGGRWNGPGLHVPHRGLRQRAFVLDPLAEIAPRWRDPVSGASVQQLRHRLRKRRPGAA